MPPPNVYFDVSIDGVPAGRIVFRLFDHICPITARNFRELATRESGPRYEGSFFHRIVPDFMIQGGDITFSGGTAGLSIYGPYFDDENFVVDHDRPGLLSMANRGPNTNSSMFFITTNPAPWCDHKNVVFGEVIEGMPLVHRIQTYTSNDILRRPSVPILITKAGVLEA